MRIKKQRKRQSACGWLLPKLNVKIQIWIVITLVSWNISTGQILGTVFPSIDTNYDAPAKAHTEGKFGTIADEGTGFDEGKIVQYPYLREADAKYKKRIWRVIDTRQKFNKSFTWPRNPFTQIIWELAVKGNVRAYSSDSLNRKLTPNEILTNCSTVQIVLVPCDSTAIDDDCTKEVPVRTTWKWEEIQKFEIMEEWIYDFKHSVFKPKIIAIAPCRERLIGTFTITEKPFWVKMEDLRPTLAKSEVYNRFNDVMRVSWDEALNQFRLFDSYIVKQTDWDDQYLYLKPEFRQDGLAALIEADKIKTELFIFEHDLWEF